MRVLAGAGRSSSLFLQWLNLEHCRCWQDSRPVWPELSDHPAPSSLWYVTQFTSSVSIWLCFQRWTTTYGFKLAGIEMDSCSFFISVETGMLQINYISGRWRGAVTCPCHSHQCSLTIWSTYCTLISQLNIFTETDVDAIDVCLDGQFLVVCERNGTLHLIYVPQKRILLTKVCLFF